MFQVHYWPKQKTVKVKHLSRVDKKGKGHTFSHKHVKMTSLGYLKQFDASAMNRSFGSLPKIRFSTEALLSTEYLKFAPNQLRPKLLPNNSTESSAESGFG